MADALGASNMDVPTLKMTTESFPEPAELGLPESLVLYLGGGIPQVFRRVNRANDSGPSGWLYLPFDMLEDAAAGRDGNCDCRDSAPEAVCIEESGRFYPLLVGGRVRGLVSDIASDGPPDCRTLLDRLSREELQMQAKLLSVQAELTAALVSSDMTPERLVRSALNLMVEQVPSGLAAIYDESEGIYRLRTAVGDIAMWDMLEGTLPPSTVGRWGEAISRGRHFLPAGFLPERPILLDGPPDFLFVHHGLQSDRPRAFITMPVPGNITREAGERLLTLARFVAALDEHQLSITEDLLGVCSLFRSGCDLGLAFSDLMVRIFEVLAGRLGLSRLTFIDGLGRGTTVTGRHDAPAAVREETLPSVATAIRAAASTGRFFAPDVSTAGLLEADEAKRYYLDNVRSEYCLRPIEASGSEGCVAFGHPEIGSRLKQFERLLETTTMFLNLYRRLDLTAANSSETFADRPATPPATSERRWATASTMAEGHFHSVFDTLSWLLGQTEVRAASAAASQVAEPPMALITEEALSEVVRHLDQLRGILRDAASHSTDSVPIERVLADLPGMLQGRIHHLQDLKGIRLAIAIGQSSGRSFSLTMRDVYDYLYPVLLSVMDESVVSGELRIRSATHRGADAVEVSCAASLTGRASLAEVLQRWSGELGEKETGGRVVFSSGQYVWVCDARTRDPQRAWLVARKDFRMPSGGRPPVRRDRETR